MPIRLTGMISNLDTDAIIKELMSIQTSKKTAVEDKKTKLEWKKEKWEEMNTKIYALYTEKLSNLKLQGSYLTKKATSTNESKATATATTAASGTYSLKISSVASSQFITGKDMSAESWTKETKLTDIGINSGTEFTVKTGDNFSDAKTVTVDEDMTIGSLSAKFESYGINFNFDEKQGRFFISGKESGADNRFTMTADGDALTKLGLVNITETMANDGYSSDGIAVTAARDSIVELNGAQLTSSTSKVSAGGLNIELTGVTSADETINITVTGDSESVYNSVKDFIKQYNELLDEMTKSYNADSAKDYHMLSDEEKESMTDEQVELWEGKIKDSLLRRDETLNSVITAMRSALQETVEVDGKNYSLSSFGIVTGVYTEKGKLHLYGDKEDTVEFSEQNDLLKKALDEDPETVSKVMSGIMSKLYDTMTDKMSVSKISSALTFYNDIAIKDQLTDYDKQIKDWETRLKDMEDRYYKQYSSMETALAKLQSQQNSLAGMLGMNG